LKAPHPPTPSPEGEGESHLLSKEVRVSKKCFKISHKITKYCHIISNNEKKCYFQHQMLLQERNL
jgi:hypothetical protein